LHWSAYTTVRVIDTMVSPNIPRCSVNLRTVCIEPASHAGARCITMNHSHQPLICTIASITHHDFIVRYGYSAGVVHPRDGAPKHQHRNPPSVRIGPRRREYEQEMHDTRGAMTERASDRERAKGL
jgi:hypothetical protein